MQGGYTVTIMPNANNRVYYMLSLFGLAHGHGAEPRGFQTARENE